MPQSNTQAIAEDFLRALDHHLNQTLTFENPHRARYSVECLSRMAHSYTKILRDRPGLEDIQHTLDAVLATGTQVSAQIPYICPECDTPHQDSKSLCHSCQTEATFLSDAGDPPANPPEADTPSEPNQPSE